mgnify:CR=1 FL=1
MDERGNITSQVQRKQFNPPSFFLGQSLCCVYFKLYLLEFCRKQPSAGVLAGKPHPDVSLLGFAISLFISDKAALLENH